MFVYILITKMTMPCSKGDEDKQEIYLGSVKRETVNENATKVDN